MKSVFLEICFSIQYLTIITLRFKRLEFIFRLSKQRHLETFSTFRSFARLISFFSWNDETNSHNSSAFFFNCRIKAEDAYEDSLKIIKVWAERNEPLYNDLQIHFNITIPPEILEPYDKPNSVTRKDRHLIELREEALSYARTTDNDYVFVSFFLSTTFYPRSYSLPSSQC